MLKLQAYYDGANGARAMHYLQNYGKEEPLYDGNAYTFSAIYHPGSSTLELYTHHLTKPAFPGGKPKYHMSKVAGHYLFNNRQDLVDALTAFRNLRDPAQEFRTNFIKAANDHAQAQAQAPNDVARESRTAKKRQGRRHKVLARNGKYLHEPQRKGIRQSRRTATRGPSKDPE